MHRAHVDDAAALPDVVHVRQAGLGGEKGAVQMDREHLLPVGKREFFDRMHDLDAGVADQHVDAAISRHHFGNGGIDLVFAGHVHRHAHGCATGFDDLVCGGLRRHLVQVGDDHFAAFAGVGEGDFLADAAGGAGDDADFVLSFMVFLSD